MDILRDNVPLTVTYWPYKDIRRYSGIQFSKNDERNNAVCYFDFFEIIQETFMHLATSGEIPVNLTATFRIKLEKYVSCLVKNADSEKVLEICNAFRKVIEKTIPESCAVAESKTESSSVFILYTCVYNKEDCLQVNPEIANNTETIKDDEYQKCLKWQKEIKNSLEVLKLSIETDPINLIAENFFKETVFNMNKLFVYVSFNEYCKSVFGEVEVLINCWEISLDRLLVEKSELKKSCNTRIKVKAEDDVKTIVELLIAIIRINIILKLSKQIFRFLADKEPTGQ